MFTPKEIETIVGRAFDNEPIQVLDYKFKLHSKVKVGFLGDHQNLEIRLKRNGSSTPETHRFFVKLVPHVSEEQSRFIRDRNIFGQEAAFFNCVLPLLQKDYVGDAFCPKCLMASENFLVLEDMRTKGFAMVDSKLFDGEHLRSAVRAQARLHATGKLAEARLGKSLKDVCPEAHIEHIYIDALMENERFDMYCDLMEKIAQKLGRDHRRIYQGFSRGFKRMRSAEGDSLVTSHGDAWPNNYLFNSKDPSKAVMVDYQLVRYAPRMYDVAQLMYLSTSRDVRRAEERRTIEAYYKELCETLERNNPELTRPSLDDLLKEYESVRLSAFLVSAMYYPIIFTNPLILGDMGVEEVYQKIMLRQNNDFVLMQYDKDKDFAKKLTELTLDIVDYCEELGIPTEKEHGVL